MQLNFTALLGTYSWFITAFLNAQSCSFVYPKPFRIHCNLQLSLHEKQMDSFTESLVNREKNLWAEQTNISHKTSWGDHKERKNKKNVYLATKDGDKIEHLGVAQINYRMLTDCFGLTPNSQNLHFYETTFLIFFYNNCYFMCLCGLHLIWELALLLPVHSSLVEWAEAARRQWRNAFGPAASGQNALSSATLRVDFGTTPKKKGKRICEETLDAWHRYWTRHSRFTLKVLLCRETSSARAKRVADRAT